MHNLNRKILKEKNFTLVNNHYILGIGSSTFTLYEEKRLNERYTARKYVISSGVDNLSGIIYTNDHNSFKSTLERLLKHFEICISKTKEIEKTKSYVEYLIKKTPFKLTTARSYSFMILDKVSYTLLFKNDYSGFRVQKTVNDISLLLLEKHFYDTNCIKEIQNSISHAKNIIEDDIENNKVVSFVS